MPHLLEIRKYESREKFQLLAAILFVATLPYVRSVNQPFMGLLLIACLINWNAGLWKQRKKTILIFISGFLIALLSGLLSPDIKEASKALTIESCLLLVPLFWGASYRPDASKDTIIKLSFITGVCTALLYLMIYFIFRMNSEHIAPANWLREEYINHAYSAPIGIHAGFFSCYVSLCIYFLITFYPAVTSTLKKTAITGLLLICFASLFMLATRSALILTFLCLFFFIPRRLKKRNANVMLLVSLVVLSLSYLFLSKSDYLQERFTENLEKDTKIMELIKLARGEDVSFEKQILKNDGTRIERWVACVRVIARRPWFGYGIGQDQKALFDEYEKLGLTVTLEKRYDSHNQFMAYFLKSGIAGFLAFVLMLGYGLRHAIRRKDKVYLSFLILMIGTSLISNLLEVNKGIFFFAFFNVFLFWAEKKPNFINGSLKHFTGSRG